VLTAGGPHGIPAVAPVLGKNWLAAGSSQAGRAGRPTESLVIDATEILRALAADEFFLVYQPTMDLRRGSCVGAETLIRWARDGRLVPPTRFIPVLERSDAIGPLTEWVIEQAGRELGSWLTGEAPVHLGVNVPPHILGRGSLRRATERAGLAEHPERLLIEITERGIADEIGLAAIRQGRALGARVAIDDFGTGEANLLQLTRLEADVIKLDKAFVDEIGADGRTPRLLKGLAALCHALEMEIIAEGVEYAAQARCLRDLGVHMAQGWYYSRPLRAREFLAFYRTYA